MRRANREFQARSPARCRADPRGGACAHIDGGVAPLQGLPEAWRRSRPRCDMPSGREILAQGGAALRVPQIGPLRAPAMVLDEARNKAELRRSASRSRRAGRCARIKPPRLRAASASRLRSRPRTVPPPQDRSGPRLPPSWLARASRGGDRPHDATGAASRNGALRTVLVEPMVTDTVAELIVGVLRDERLGLALVIGGGGVLVELMQDSQRLPPAGLPRGHRPGTLGSRRCKAPLRAIVVGRRRGSSPPGLRCARR